MIARRRFATIALAMALPWAGCTPATSTPRAARTPSYSARTEGPPTALLAHLESLDKRYGEADHRDLDAFRADLRAYSDAAVATADALIDSKLAPDGIRRQAAEAKLNALIRRNEADPKALDAFLVACDRLGDEPADTGLPTLAALRRVQGMIEAVPLEEMDEKTFDRLLPAADRLANFDPPIPESAPILLDVAQAAEKRHKIKMAKGLYSALASRFADLPAGKFAPGCVARLDSLTTTLANFSGPSLIDDTRIDLADYRGKVVLVDFWASWCAPCIAEMRELKGLRELLAPQGFEILGVCLDEDPSRPREGVKKYAINWPHIRALAGGKEGEAPGETLPMRFGVEKIPFKMVIDREGRFVASGGRLSDVQEAIKAALEVPPDAGK